MNQYDRIQSGKATAADIAAEIKAKAINAQTYRRTPGHFLVEEFVVPYYPAELSDLAKRTGIPYSKIQQLVRGNAKIDNKMAIAFGNFFPNTDKDFWLNLQERFERGENI